MSAVLYRAEGVTYAPPVDEFDNPYGEGRAVVRIDKYAIIDYTPSGAWIAYGCERGKFVNLRATKQWACASEAEARDALRHRKRRQITILSGQIRTAERVLAILDGEPL